MGLKLNVAHTLLAYADGVMLLRDIHTTRRKQTVIDASKAFGLEINNAVSSQNVGQCHDIK
jgi:hypothetical protein